MKQQGNCITGDPISVNNFTSKWLSVKIHPTTFYRRYSEFMDGLTGVVGLYTTIDVGQYVVVRFSDKEDLTAFHRLHHMYI